jgi:hypothetical protein
MNLQTILYILLCYCIFSLPLQAGSWDPPAGSDRYWCDTSNWWYNDGPPTSADYALINSTDEGPAIIDVTCPAYASNLIISQLGDSAQVNVNPGGSLEVVTDVVLGNYSQVGTLRVLGYVDIGGNVDVGYFRPTETNPRGIGVLDIEGGRVYIGGNMNLGHQGGDGTIKMHGGLLDITGELDILNGDVTVHDGIVYAADITFITPHGSVDIRDNGTIVLWKDYRGIYSFGLHSITACGGQGTVEIDYYTNATVVWTTCRCPEADVTGDCVVDLQDLAELSGQWLD